MGNCSDQSSVAADAPRMQEIRNVPSSAATPLSGASMTAQPTNGMQFDTIVIGGGMSGISAAVQLAKSNQRVAVLQANSFIGGRMKTIPINMQSGGVLQFDEGASWIHGSCKQHPITILSKGVNGLFTKNTEDDSTEVYDQQGNQVSDQVQEGFQLYEKLMEKVEQYEPETSMREAFEKEEQGCVQNKFFLYNVSNDLQFQTSGPIQELSSNAMNDQDYKGTQTIILSGYQRFVETLASQARFDIYLNQKIQKISWNEDHNEIICQGGITVYAKNVVVSVPLGALKANSIKFEPSLPDWKLEAIKSIGFGNVCKILLDFPNMDFLDSKSHYIGVVSEDVSKRGLCTYFLNLNALAGIPALMTFGLGDNADEAQKMSQSNLKALLVKRINIFAKKTIGTNDFKIYKTSWKANKNFEGTYAYGSITTLPEHWKNMATPIFGSNWYFCGEHTTSRYRGSVHGAYLSGIKAAKSIIQGVSQEDWEYSQISEKSEKKQEESQSKKSSQEGKRKKHKKGKRKRSEDD